MQPTPVYELAQRLGIPTLTPVSLKKPDFARAIAELKPDLIVVIAFRILPRSVFSIPRLGSVNIHASLLPKYRGAAPINWALINGEEETGLSSFFLKKSVDTGDVILQQATPIHENDSYDTLAGRLAKLSGPFLMQTIHAIESGNAEPLPQDDAAATPAPKLTPFDALIDFGFPARKVRNFVRGLSSRPGAYTTFRDKRIKILSAALSDLSVPPLSRPGEIISADRHLAVRCADTALELLQVVPEGKKPMDGHSFINGFHPQTGEIFGESLAH
jgi:methionyl-tRNA formyltransferase